MVICNASKTSHSLRVNCATRLFQESVPEKLIRERTGHRSKARLASQNIVLNISRCVSLAVVFDFSWFFFFFPFFSFFWNFSPSTSAGGPELRHMKVE